MPSHLSPHHPTGLGVWPASILMARYAVQMREALEGRVVLELGCGCGLPGLAAGKRLTDD